MSDIGAIEFGWWHAWHFDCRIGATSFVNTKGAAECASAATTDGAPANVAASATEPMNNILMTVSSLQKLQQLGEKLLRRFKMRHVADVRQQHERAVRNRI